MAQCEPCSIGSFASATGSGSCQLLGRNSEFITIPFFLLDLSGSSETSHLVLPGCARLDATHRSPGPPPVRIVQQADGGVPGLSLRLVVRF